MTKNEYSVLFNEVLRECCDEGREFDFYRLYQLIEEKAREEEREACAKVCEAREEQWWKAGFFKDVHEFREMAFAIRSRSSEH